MLRGSAGRGWEPQVGLKGVGEGRELIATGELACGGVVSVFDAMSPSRSLLCGPCGDGGWILRSLQVKL